VIQLNDIIVALTNKRIPPLAAKLSNAVIDSREAKAGSLFIALPGENVDGHDYVQAAFENGATAALVSKDLGPEFHVIDLRPNQPLMPPDDIHFPLCLRVEDTLSALQTIAAYWRRAHDVRVIGITGSVGKTSTKELIASLLAQKYTILKNPGNRNNEIGLPLTLLELGPQHDYAVLEMGFYVPGEIRLLCEIAQPQVGVVTNIGTVHAERAGSQEIIAKGKAELVESLPPAPDGVAILNMDDPWVLYMFGKTRAKVFSYGVKDDADLSASQIKSLGLDGITCILSYAGEEHKINSPLMGEFSVYTLLRAAGVGLAEGLDWPTIKTGLAKAQVDIRMRRVDLPGGVTLLDDTYNAAPESTTAALELLGGLPGRRVAILGDMLELGQYETSGHQSVGKMAAETADRLILVGSRSKQTAQAALEAGFNEANLQWYPDSQAACEPALALVQKGDTVLIKGSNSMRMNKILAALEGSK
jgi:UDP-N-acetylmuramoyl-tripeptide--D-alanyl-D-alanine ligase